MNPAPTAKQYTLVVCALLAGCTLFGVYMSTLAYLVADPEGRQVLAFVSLKDGVESKATKEDDKKTDEGHEIPDTSHRRRRDVFVQVFDFPGQDAEDLTHQCEAAFRRSRPASGMDLEYILALPMPLGGSHREACELARIAVAVWHVDASKFKEFQDWWVLTERRTIVAAKVRAEKLVGNSELQAELAKPHAKESHQSHNEGYYTGSGRTGSLTTLIFTDITP